MNAFLVRCTTLEEERYALTGALQAHLGGGVAPADGISGLGKECAGLLLDAGGCRGSGLRPRRPSTAHAHHGRKYADGRLPDDKAFRFREDAAGTVAHSVAEFCAGVEHVPVASLRHHLLGGDFSRWAADVLGDTRLAVSFRKLEQTTRLGATPSREEILAHVRDLYVA